MSMIQTVLHPTDFSERSLYALHMSASVARDSHARLVILHVIPYKSEKSREVIEEQLHTLEVPGGGLLVERVLMEGSPSEKILHFARKALVDLIVMGAHGHTKLSHRFQGSVTEQVLLSAPCPVLTINTPFQAVSTPSKPVGQKALALVTQI